MSQLSPSVDVIAAPPKGWLKPPARTSSSVSSSTPGTASTNSGSTGGRGAASTGGPDSTLSATPTSRGVASENATRVLYQSFTDALYTKPWFSSSPTLDRSVWKEFVQEFSMVPESISAMGDRRALKLVSDHDLPSSTLPCWDLYRIIKVEGGAK